MAPHLRGDAPQTRPLQPWKESGEGRRFSAVRGRLLVEDVQAEARVQIELIQ